VDTHSNAVALLLFTLVSPVFTIFMQPISAYFQRKFEFEADDFASNNAKASKMISGLVKLYEENASTLHLIHCILLFITAIRPQPFALHI
jgi:STE24 endopeptidase